MRRKTRTVRSGGVLMGLALVLTWAPPVAQAKTTTWTGTGQNWNEAFWDNGSPANGDDVVIDGNVVLSNSTPVLNLFTLNAGKTNTFLGTNTFLLVTNATISGTVTHSNNTATTTNALGQWVPDNLVNFWAYSNLTIAAGGQVNVDGKGYGGAVNGPANGYGPGAGIYYYGGGSYGGAGAGVSGGTYGMSNAPVDPGSGGSGHSANQGGGNGGGVAIIQVGGRITVNGTISANGNPGQDTYGAGGSGGGVYIACGAFDGAGVIRANGGSIPWGGGGGGGRIAVVYTNAAAQGALTPSVSFDAKGGNGGGGYANGVYGTLYLPDTTFFPYQTLQGSYWIMIPGFTNWAPSSLTVTNGTVQFPDNFQLNVTNDVTVENAGWLILTNGTVLACSNLTLRGTLTADRPVALTGSLSLPAGGTGDFPCPLIIDANWTLAGALYLRNPNLTNKVFTCSGDLIITNGGKFYAWSGLTNAASPDYGGLVAVTGDVVIANNSFFYPSSHPTNGGSLYLQMRNLRVLAGGMIDADGKGFWGAPSISPGYGSGGGTNYYGGGSYGGLGGGFSGGSPGGTYGVSNAPIDPGSGGAGNTVGGNGGGAVRVRAVENVTVDGTISANGNNPPNSGLGGGGSGGGIYIACDTFDGTGLISANAGSTPWGCGGGGGRIAIVYTNASAQGSLTPTVNFSANGGAGTFASGACGTLYLPDTNFILRPAMMGGYQLLVPGFASWAPSTLTVSNGPIQFPDGFQLSVAGNITITNGGGVSLRNYAAVTSGGNLLIGGGSGQVVVADHSYLAVAGDMIITNTGVLSVYAGLTNSVGSPGLLVNVAGNMSIGPSSAAYVYSHPTNGGSALIRVKDLIVAAGGQINADARGFAGGTEGTSRGLGYGPGAGAFSFSYNFCRCGAGYGGMGGAGNVGTPGSTYGSSNAPIDAGSGGQGNGWGGNGGGLIRIEASGQIKVDGVLTADGGNGAAGGYSGGGSGGGIYLQCRIFSGSGWVRSKGGASAETSYSGGGGGGRIAIWRVRDLWTGTNLDVNVVSGGSGWNSGATGTVVLGWLMEPGTVFVVH